MRALMRSDREAWRRQRDPSMEPEPTPGTRAFARVGQALMRIQNHLHSRGLVPFARLIFMFNLTAFGFEMIQGVSIGPRFRMVGCFGSIVRAEVVMGADVSMGDNVGLGSNLGKTGMPVIGSGVIMRSGATIYGPVDVGDNTIIGVSTVLMSSVPAEVIVDQSDITPLA